MDQQGTGRAREENRQQESQQRTPTGTQSNQESRGEQSQGMLRRQGRAEESYGMERRSQERGGYPSVFSVSPGEFFTMSPITLMRRFTEDIDRAFGLRSGSNRGDFSELQDISWIPPVEVRQSGNNLVIHADLPGLSENDVKVEATDEGLVIPGGRRREHTSEEGGWRHSERVYGRFYRLIPLPESAKIEETKANF